MTTTNKTPSVFKPGPGGILYNAAIRAIRIANDLREEIVLDFNGTKVHVRPDINVDRIIMDWCSKRKNDE